MDPLSFQKKVNNFRIVAIISTIFGIPGIQRLTLCDLLGLIQILFSCWVICGCLLCFTLLLLILWAIYAVGYFGFAILCSFVPIVLLIATPCLLIGICCLICPCCCFLCYPCFLCWGVPGMIWGIIDSVNAEYYIAKRKGVNLQQMRGMYANPSNIQSVMPQGQPASQYMPPTNPSMMPQSGYPMPQSGYPNQYPQPQYTLPLPQSTIASLPPNPQNVQMPQYRPLPSPVQTPQVPAGQDPQKLYSGQMYPPLPNEKMPDYNGPQKLYPSAQQAQGNQQPNEKAAGEEKRDEEDIGSSTPESPVVINNLKSVYIPREDEDD